MAIHIPSTAFRPCTITLALPARDRKAVERQIEALIELLDALDGDAELEDDELHDDVLDLGEGSDELATLPSYAVDQTSGPLNYLAARAAQIERAA